MTWTYKQSTGEMFHNGSKVDTGYSGVLTNKNNPDRQQVKNMGPLPRGAYAITGHGTSKGPVTIILEQRSGENFGRNGFLIHGERRNMPQGFASAGCIILNVSTRNRILMSGDNNLEVIR